MVNRRATEAIIVGAGPSGLATSACLSRYSIPHVVLEQEHCHSSLWKMKAYDRCNLHLAKEFSQLPYMPHMPHIPTYIPRKTFIQYLDNYVDSFDIRPIFCRRVESAFYDQKERMWSVVARNTKEKGKGDVYTGKFLVVATGENSEGNIPDIEGLESFTGEMMHSSHYKTGLMFNGKKVLVVGCGNSGMEIAYDLYTDGAQTSIVVRSPFHVVTKEMIRVGMSLMRLHFPIWLVDSLILVWAKFKFGNLSKYKITKPINGPMLTKAVTGRSPVIDVGTIQLIKSGKIKVVSEISNIQGSKVGFVDGKQEHFDAIIFATGYKSTARNWFKENYFLDEGGMPLQKFPHHWKGKNGVYCAGLSQKGLTGVSFDAQLIADDILQEIRMKKNARNY